MSNTLAIVLLFALLVLLGYLVWWFSRQARHNKSMSSLRRDQSGDTEIDREMSPAGTGRTGADVYNPPVSPSTGGAPVAASMAAGTVSASLEENTATPTAEAGHQGERRHGNAPTPRSEEDVLAGSSERDRSATGSGRSDTQGESVGGSPTSESISKPALSVGKASRTGGVSSKNLAKDRDNQQRVLAGRKPETLDGPGLEAADSLQAIGGIDSNLERKLNQAGVYYFSQIASWNDEEIAWIEDYLGSTAHVRRDDWQGQAERLQAMHDPKI